MPERRFPPPWSVEGTDACFIVRDANGQALAYFVAAHLLTGDETRRRCNIAKRAAVFVVTQSSQLRFFRLRPPGGEVNAGQHVSISAQSGCLKED
jgi:hypothetical protein